MFTLRKNNVKQITTIRKNIASTRHFYYVFAALIAQHLQGLSYGVWIGYHYVTNYDQWVWADNSETQYENWGTNSPGDLVSPPKPALHKPKILHTTFCSL